MTLKPFLEVKNLNVAFPTEDGLVQASNDISFTVARGETLPSWVNQAQVNLLHHLL